MWTFFAIVFIIILLSVTCPYVLLFIDMCIVLFIVIVSSIIDTWFSFDKNTRIIITIVCIGLIILPIIL